MANRTAILGAGLTGLYLGSRLAERGTSIAAFEAESAPGGLARTFRTGEYLWDMGVHALYSKNSAVMEYVRSLPLDYIEHGREVRICHASGGQIYELDYPFENGLAGLPDEDWEDCVVGYMEARLNQRSVYSHIRDWIEQGLGTGIARCFMTPYNQKIWNCPLDRISMDLVNKKIDPAPFEEVLATAMGKKSVGRAYQSTFVYPRRGIQELCDHFAGHLGERLKTGRRLAAIETTSDNGNEHTLVFEDGSREGPFNRLVSTLPLTALARMTPWSGLEEDVKELRCNDTVFVMVGLRHGVSFQRFNSLHWAFFAGDEVYYRLTFMHSFTPEGMPCVVAERTIKSGETLDPALVETKVVTDLIRQGIVASEADIATVASHFQQATYPIPTLGLKAVRDKAVEVLGQRGIYILGRGGAWDYINMDQVIERVDSFVWRVGQNFA